MRRTTIFFLGVIGVLTTSTIVFAYNYYTTYALLGEYADLLIDCVGRLIKGEEIGSIQL